jgi:hypothetical protein
MHPVGAPGASAPESPGEPREVSPEDRELLEELDLLLQWEMLVEWDPEEDLPIPIEEPERAEREASP